MKTVSIHDAKTNLSKYIAAAKTGEQIYIGSYGKREVVLQLAALEAKPKKRKLGGSTSIVWASDDAFSRETDEALAEELLRDNLNI